MNRMIAASISTPTPTFTFTSSLAAISILRARSLHLMEYNSSDAGKLALAFPEVRTPYSIHNQSNHLATCHVQIPICEIDCSTLWTFLVEPMLLEDPDSAKTCLSSQHLITLVVEAPNLERTPSRFEIVLNAPRTPLKSIPQLLNHLALIAKSVAQHLCPHQTLGITLRPTSVSLIISPAAESLYVSN